MGVVGGGRGVLVGGTGVDVGGKEVSVGGIDVGEGKDATAKGLGVGVTRLADGPQLTTAKATSVTTRGHTKFCLIFPTSSF